MLFVVFSIAFAGHVLAATPESGPAASLEAHTTLTGTETPLDMRVEAVKQLLAAYDSPLYYEAAHFVEEADTHGIDWRLVVAIAGVESTFGKRIPSGSYNAWGWGVYTGRQTGAVFESWLEGIHTVSAFLRTKYIDDDLDSIPEIGQRYAASGAWSGNVQYFVNQLDDYHLRILALQPALD